MAMTYTQKELDDSELLLISMPNGDYKWSSHRSREEVAQALHDIANQIEDGENDNEL